MVYLLCIFFFFGCFFRLIFCPSYYYVHTASSAIIQPVQHRYPSIFTVLATYILIPRMLIVTTSTAIKKRKFDTVNNQYSTNQDPIRHLNIMKVGERLKNGHVSNLLLLCLFYYLLQNFLVV